MKIRNRNYISEIRKKFERLEQFKKDNVITPFKTSQESDSIIRELEFEIMSIKRELKELSDKNSGINQDPIKLCTDTFGDRFRFENGYMFMEYKDVNIIHNGKKIVLGDYKATITPRRHIVFSGGPNVKSGTFGDVIHPHILLDGSACFGDFLDPIHKCYDSQNYVKMFELINTFLNSYNHRSTYLKIAYWDPDTVYCDECGYLPIDCECDEYFEDEDEDEDEDNF